MVYFGIILCFLPILVLVLVFTLSKKLPILHELLAILFGLLAVLPISIIQFYIPPLPILQNNPILYSLLRSIFLYGFIEEIIKMFFLMPLPHKDYSALKFLMLSFVLGLSLGCFESGIYFLDRLQIAYAKGGELIFSQIFKRIFSSDLIHMACTGLTGLFIYSYRQKNRRIIILVTAFITHGIYDFFAGFNSNFKNFAIAGILFALIECRVKYKSLSTPSQ